VLLARIGPPASPALLVALKSRSPEIRAAAARVLGTWLILGENPDLRPLIALLQDKEDTVQLAAAEAIAAHRARDDEGAGAMMKLLSHPRAEFRRAGAASLAERKESDVSIGLAECLLDPDEDVRVAACLSLVSGKGDEAMLGLGDDPSPKVRQAFHQNQRTVLPTPRIVEADLRADDLALRLDAASHLGWRSPKGSAQVLPMLLGILEGWDESARQQAAETIAILGENAKAALPALRRRIRRDASDDVRRACEEAIKAIEGRTK
jgi:HEAT repeat protein